jgi:hypothetical protein
MAGTESKIGQKAKSASAPAAVPAPARRAEHRAARRKTH